jgi:hypothetical protein
MKRILFLDLALLFVIAVYSQNYEFPKNADGEYEFSEVVESNLSKGTLFANATSWAMKFYEEDGYKNVVQLESELEGRLVIKDYDVVIDGYEVKNKSNFRTEKVYYTLTIDCKDNKYRYVIDEIKIKSPSSRFSMIGVDLEWDVNRENHLETISNLKRDKEMLESQIQNVKGRKLSKLQKQLDEINEKVKAETDMYYEEFTLFDRLINSLKKKMSTNSDF